MTPQFLIFRERDNQAIGYNLSQVVSYKTDGKTVLFRFADSEKPTELVGSDAKAFLEAVESLAVKTVDSPTASPRPQL